VVSPPHARLQRNDVFDALRVEGRWERQLNRSFGLHAGYAREEFTHSVAPAAGNVHEYIDIGVDFADRLAVARRTSLSFTTQTSVIKKPVTGRSYRLNGSASLMRLFGRTGSMSLGVSRNTEFVPGFIEPLFSSGAYASISGMPSRRTEWDTTLSAGRGRFGYAESGDFASAQLASRFNVAVTPRLGVFLQYAAYYYDVPRGQATFPLLGQVSRQALSAGISTWLPLIHRLRAPRDPE
jgi:hypothetical protein